MSIQTFDISKYLLVFSSNSCLKSGTECRTAQYVCLINGKLEMFKTAETYDDAHQNCKENNGYLSTPTFAEIENFIEGPNILWTDLFRETALIKLLLIPKHHALDGVDISYY